MAKDYRAVSYQVLKEGSWENRYRIISTETGAVLDDANGYGYKSARAAYASYGYKHRDRSKDLVKKSKKKHIKAWLDSHQDFEASLAQAEFEIAMGEVAEDKLDAKAVKYLLKEAGLEPDFTASELLKVWKGK